MSHYLYAGSYDKIAQNMLLPGRWEPLDRFNVNFKDVTLQVPDTVPVGDVVLNVKAGSHAKKNLAIIYNKDVQPAADSVPGKIYKRLGKNKSTFDIMMLPIGKQTLILLLTKDRDAKGMTDDMKTFIQNAKDKNYLSSIDGEQVVDNFNMLKSNLMSSHKATLKTPVSAKAAAL